MNIYKWGVTHMSHWKINLSALTVWPLCINFLQLPSAFTLCKNLIPHPPIAKKPSPPSDCKNPSQPSDWKTHPIFRLELEPPQLTSVTFQTVAFSLIEINFLISKLNSRFTVWKIHPHLPELELELPQLKLLSSFHTFTFQTVAVQAKPFSNIFFV